MTAAEELFNILLESFLLQHCAAAILQSFFLTK